MRTNKSLTWKATGVIFAGAVAVALGLLWNMSFPINKSLWTSSFVLYSAGWSLLLLSFFLWLVDFYDRRADQAANSAKQPRRFTGLLVFGMNAIAAYIFAELLEAVITAIHLKSGQSIQQTIYQAIHRFVSDGAWASFLYSLVFVATCWVPMYWLYRKHVFIKI
jgi:predicted acyltransferase